MAANRNVLGDVCPRCFADLRGPGALYRYAMSDGRTLRQCAACRRERSKDYERKRRQETPKRAKRPKKFAQRKYRPDPKDENVIRARKERERVLKLRAQYGDNWYKRSAA